MRAIPFKHKIANKFGRMIKNIKGGYLGRERFIFTYLIYHFLPYLGYDYCKLIEWKFILKNLPKGGNIKILDVGCTSSLLIYELACYGDVFGLDTRPYFEKLPKKIKFIQGDIINLPFPDNSFDYITCISVIEHIGLGAYGDPISDDGDIKAMRELKRILKIGGNLLITTVIGNKYITTPNGNARIYDKKRLNALIDKFLIIKEEYYIFRKKWLLTHKDIAFQENPERFGLASLYLKK